VIEFIKYIYLKVVKRKVAIHPIGESEAGNGTKMAYEYEYDKSDDIMTVPVQGFESANFAKKYQPNYSMETFRVFVQFNVESAYRF
jgi:hypothetical protein